LEIAEGLCITLKNRFDVAKHENEQSSPAPSAILEVMLFQAEDNF
jgi:hypothetical protein